MAGTVSGGRKAAITNRQRHGKNFYSRIAQLAGQSSDTGGFACPRVGKDGLTGPERAKVAGSIGGKSSRRSKAVRRSGNPTSPRKG